MKNKKILIVGGGMAGCACANILSEIDNVDLTIVDKAPFLGAGVRTFFYANKHPYTYGPRHFLSTNKDIYEYFNKIIPMRSVTDHKFISYVEKDDQFYHYPVNFDDVNMMPDSDIILDEIKNKKTESILNSKNLEEYWVNSIGHTLYDKIIKNYNQKMWMVDDNRKIDTFNWSPKGATIKKGSASAWEGIYSCYPIKYNGYNDYFDRLYEKKNVKIYLNSKINNFNLDKKEFQINDDKKIIYDIVISTISPDYFFNYDLGELKFLGRDMFFIMFPNENVFSNNVSFVYYANKEKFTRMVEFKKFTKFKSKNSLIGLEFPSHNGKFYPMPFKDEIRKSLKYVDRFPEWFFSVGRAGTYRYAVDIDDCIEQALEIKKIVNNDNYENPFPLKKWYNLDLYELNENNK